MISVASTDHPEYRQGCEVERHTFLLDSGPHKGVSPHYFSEGELRRLFGQFHIFELGVDSAGTHFVLFAEKP